MNWADTLALFLTFTSETRESFADYTIPALEKVIHPLRQYIHLKIFQELPPPERKGTIEDFEALAMSLNGMFK